MSSPAELGDDADGQCSYEAIVADHPRHESFRNVCIGIAQVSECSPHGNTCRAMNSGLMWSEPLAGSMRLTVSADASIRGETPPWASQRRSEECQAAERCQVSNFSLMHGCLAEMLSQSCTEWRDLPGRVVPLCGRRGPGSGGNLPLVPERAE